MMKKLIFFTTLFCVIKISSAQVNNNTIFIQCPIENNEDIDSEEFNKIVKRFELRFENVLIIRLDKPENYNKQKYLDFAEEHKNWGMIYYNWNSETSKSDYINVSNSNLNIASAKLTFSIKQEIDVKEINQILAEGLVKNFSKKSSQTRFYYELSKKGEKDICLTGELFDFLLADCEKIAKKLMINPTNSDETLLDQSKNLENIFRQFEILENQNKRLISKADSILKGNIDIKKDIKRKGNTGFSNVSVSSQVYKNLSSISVDAMWKNEVEWYSQYGFGLGFRSGQFAYDLYENQRSYTNQNSLISLGDIREKGNIRFLSAKASFVYSNVVHSKLGSSSHDFFWFSLKLNFCGNFIQSSQYSWISGSMNVRGKLDGIGDEIINVPDLGYRDGINLVGVNGTADLKRFFPSVEGEVTLHYNLEKMDFFGGMGYTASPILKASRPDLLISDGTHFNSLTATTNPISIRTPFISIGMSIIF